MARVNLSFESPSASCRAEAEELLMSAVAEELCAFMIAPDALGPLEMHRILVKFKLVEMYGNTGEFNHNSPDAEPVPTDTSAKPGSYWSNLHLEGFRCREPVITKLNQAEGISTFYAVPTVSRAGENDDTKVLPTKELFRVDQDDTIDPDLVQPDLNLSAVRLQLEPGVIVMFPPKIAFHGVISTGLPRKATRQMYKRSSAA